MTSTRIVLVQRPGVPERESLQPKIRHYRIARLRLAERRGEIQPRHAHLRETYD
jgi:hypothetical protein